MSTAQLRFGIPDIDLRRADGGTVNPSAFAGHVLVVLFCPAGSRDATSGCEDFDHANRSLRYYGGWLLPIRDSASVPEPDALGAGTGALDSDGAAWTAFRNIAPPELELHRSEGATYLFARGGSLERVWPGVGHASEVIEELARPCFATEDMGVNSEALPSA